MINNIHHKIITQFIIKNRESCYRLAYSYVRNKEDALDVVQDAICKALNNEHSLKDLSNVKPWFYRILVNSAIDTIRKNKKYVYVEDDSIEALGGFKNDTYENIDLKEAIEKLPERDKTIIMLRFYEGMKLDDIAMTLNENVNTVKTRLYSCIGRLKLDLEGSI